VKTEAAAGMRVVRDLSVDRWRAALASLPGATVFHTPEMFEVFTRTSGHAPELWAAVRGEDVLALFTPVTITLREGLARFLTTRTVAYTGPLRAEGPEGEAALAAVLAAAEAGRDRATLFTEVRHVTDPTHVRSGLESCGYAPEGHLNYLVDVGKPAEEVLGQIRTRTRKQIRQGLRRGTVTVGFVETREDVAVCHELLTRTYARARVPAPDRSLLEAAFDVLHPAGMALFALARIDGRPVAASVELPWGDTVYGWYGAVDRAWAKEVPGELLMWRVLEWASQNGYRTYDFGGAGKPGEEYGVRDFKAKFGGDLVSFGRHTKRHARARLAVATAGYALSRRLAR
jgi:CelD/BcsL family acetyltransferase involved in cellulose biosynthesis